MIQGTQDTLVYLWYNVFVLLSFENNLSRVQFFVLFLIICKITDSLISFKKQKSKDMMIKK